MSPDESSEKIRRRMAELRRELECDVQEVSRAAHVMSDWTFYVRRFPWAVALVAAGAGFLLIPKRKEIIKPDPDMIAEMVKKKQIRVQPVSRDKEQQGFMKTLLVMGITWAARTGASYMTQRIGDVALHKSKSDSQSAPRRPLSEPAPSPLDEPWKAEKRR